MTATVCTGTLPFKPAGLFGCVDQRNKRGLVDMQRSGQLDL
jgi:hypothetical protein